MPIDYKKLYQSHDIILTNANPESLVEDGTLESVDYLKNYFKSRERYKPPVDFSKLKNFARFGSAKKYYVDAFDRITETYPYDGSLKERIDWELSSSYFDLYVFDQVYPRSNGYVIFSAESWGTQIADSDGYGAPATASYEYVFIKGGPHGSTRSKEKDVTDVTGDYKSGYANVWDPAKDRESNLKIGGAVGNTVEFWMKKSEFITSRTEREVIFDACTSDFDSSSANYGRLTIEMTGALSASPFRITYMSGTSGFFDEIVGASITTSSVADDSWHHYAIALKNAGSNVEINFYIDGACNETIVTGSSINYVSGNINATIGSLITAPSGTTQPTKGWGKLSGSLDEFRFWKDERSSAEVLRYMIEPVGGGTNTDDANTSLGVYYKFNEGISGDSEYDQTVLDYSGRISNGTFNGYSTSARNVGSAMVDSGLVTSEFKDPILYTFHPDIQSILETRKKEGEIHDFANNAAIYHSLPAWITEEDEDKEYSPLKNLTQVVGSYFDSLAEQINSIPQLKHKTYLSSSHKPAPFNDRLLNSIGFDYFPELFSDATELEYFRSRDDRSLFENKLYDVKNRIYQNIYNNIIYINKTKGTEKSFRNLIHCFGLGDEIYRINTYGNRVTYTLKDNYKSIAEFKKYVNFSLTGSSEATVFPHSSSANSNSKAIISASHGLTDYLGFTMESEVQFPIRHSLVDTNTVATTDEGPSRQFRTYIPYTTASLFGMHQLELDASGNDLTWASNDYANFQVFAIKASDYSQRAQFVLTGTDDSVIGALNLTSSYVDDVFDDTRWTFSVSVKPNSNVDLPDGSSGSLASSGYTVEFYGVEKIVDYVKNEFYVTGTITADEGSKFLNYPKAPYIGAHRTNFSGGLLQKADGNISSARVWYSYLPTGTIQQHHQDVKNFGVEHPYRSAYLYPTELDGIKIPSIDTLVLNWTFDTVTGSDSSGEFIGEDYSSGSAEKISKYGEFGELVGKQYLPKGYNFPANSTLPINRKFISSGKKQLPEMINSSDMVNILTEDDRFFNKVDLMRPTNYYTSIEKSMYQTISDEMVKMFSSIKDFNNLVGEPVNKYRHEYKDMEKLRQLFYERVGNTPDLDKYIDFYKWVDITLDTLLGYLVPISSDMGDRYGSNIRTMVENTVLHRNKYKWQYPTFEDKTPDIEGNILGINELLYNWEFGFHPLNSEDNKCLWWKERAERADALSSGDTNVDSNKQTMLNSIVNETNATAPTLGSRDSDTGVVSNYEGSTYVTRRLAKPLRLKVDKSPVYKQSPSMYENKNIGFFDALNTVFQPDAGFQNNYSFWPGYDISPSWQSLGSKGSTDIISYSDSGSDGEGFSVNTWVKFDVAPGSHGSSHTGYIFNSFQKNLYAWKVGSDSYFGFSMVNHTGSSLPYAYVSTHVKLDSDHGVDSVADSWINVGVTYDGRGGTNAHDGAKWFINGTEYSASFGLTSGSYDHMGTGSVDWELGSSTYSTSRHEGYIDDFSVWSGSLSASTMQEIYNNGLPLDISSITPLVSGSNGDGTIPIWYRFGDGSGDVVSGDNKVIKNLGTQASVTNSELTGAYTPDSTYPLSDNYFTAPNYAGYPIPYGIVYVKSSDVDSFKDCSDDLTLNNGKRKYNFKAKSKAIGTDFSVDQEYKGDKILPFNLYSASIDGGVNDAISSSFMDGVDITNLHMDTYGPDYETPMQTPFTEKFVGGRAYRHIFSNFTPDNDPPDQSSERIEGWYLDLKSTDSSLRLYSTNAERIYEQKATFFRDEYAKRPVNIRNIKMLTGSDADEAGRSDVAIGVTNIGNYTDNYEVVMTTGRTINNRYLAEAPDGLPTTYTESTAVSGVIDFAMPRRDLTGSTKSIIVNRFSSPGDPATMGQGMLDIAAGEYSVYNSLTWRNLSVRQPLNEWYADHNEQFGYFSDAKTVTDYELADETYPGGNSEVTSSDYSGTGSFHKINRNARKVIRFSGSSTSSYVDDEVYDNWFVQHQIPQTDLQYVWITASVVNDYDGPALYGYEQPDYSNASLASTDLTFCSASDFGSYMVGSNRVWGGTNAAVGSQGFVATDFVGINSNIYEPTTSSTNTLGFPLGTRLVPMSSDQIGYLNVDASAVGHVGFVYANAARQYWSGSEAFNALILHRQGPYGWPSWKQIRGAQHPVMRYNYRNNLHTFEKVVTTIEQDGYVGQYKTVVSQSEPPITSKFAPLKYKITYNSDQPFSYVPHEGSLGQDPQFTNMWTSYGNEKVYFTTVPDPKITGLIDLNNSKLVWSQAGQIGETLQSADNKILAYDTLKKYLLWNTPEYIGGSANPISKLHSLEISETVFPREHYTYTTMVRQRANFANNFWKDSRSDRNTISVNSQGLVATASAKDPASMWAMDARTDFESVSTANLSVGSGSEGELQNSYSIFCSGGNENTIRAAATYNRRIPERINNVTYYLGDTKWEAGEQSGYNPSYNTYAEFVEDVRSLGKDYGVVPEYRLSEHMEYHVVDMASSGGFYADNPGWLTLAGATISSSNDPSHNGLIGSGSFYTVYTNSDFMKYFAPINQEFSTVAMPTKLKLKCKAITKFLPYDGFYPSERTVQLAQLFSQSFGPAANLGGPQATWKTLLTPFFAPGILYNSIKSGIAVDFPVFDIAPPASFSRSAVQANFSKRMPFEALIDPDYWLAGIGEIHDVEPDNNSANIISTGSFGAPANALFKYAINNFMTEVPRFFLGGTDGKNTNQYGPLTTFVSKATQEGNAPPSPLGSPKNVDDFIFFETGKTYKMRIVCSHSKIRNLETIEKNPDYMDATASYMWNEPTIMMYNRAFNRSSTSEYADLYFQTTTGEPDTDMSVAGYGPLYGSSFGVASSQAKDNSDGSQIAAGYEPFTPPYYNGYSHIELSYTPEYSGYKTISDIIAQVSASHYRAPLHSGTIASRARDQAMQLSASINWRQIVTEEGKTRWVIQPKWESPILDFKNSSITLPTIGSGSVAKGMWHQYGTIPEVSDGVFMEIQFPDGGQIGDTVGNLAEKLGFNTNTSQKLGQIPIDGKTVSEAIVAVPFYENFWGHRTFFHLNKKTISWAQAKISETYTTDEDYISKRMDLSDYDMVYKPSASVVDMVKAMYKYSLPPSFNFLTRPDQEPFSMVFFEFDHHFTQDDLVKMWQGVLPSESRKNATSGVQHAVSEIEFGMNLLTGREHLYGENPDPTKYKGWDLLNAIPGNKTGDLGFPTNIQWMVFKVKQKAMSHYYNLTADNMDNFGTPTLNYIPEPSAFSFIPFYMFWESPIMKMANMFDKLTNFYRHNWPYDFFSLVELAKIEETIVLEPREEIPDTLPNIIDLINLLPPVLNMNFIPFYDSVTTINPDLLVDTVSALEKIKLPGWTKYPEWVPDISPIDRGSLSGRAKDPAQQDRKISRQKELEKAQKSLRTFSASQFVALQTTAQIRALDTMTSAASTQTYVQDLGIPTKEQQFQQGKNDKNL